jgi:hypothetical protein
MKTGWLQSCRARPHAGSMIHSHDLLPRGNFSVVFLWIVTSAGIFLVILFFTCTE